MRRVYRRAAARRDLVEHYVYLAEQADLDVAERFFAQAEHTFVELAENAAHHARAFSHVVCMRLLCATLPATGMAASMDYCHNDDFGLLYSEVYSERKARHQRTACIAMNHWVCQRLFGNELKSRKRFIQEFVPETLALLFVP